MADDTPPSPFSEEQTNSLRQLVSQIVNSSIRARDVQADKKRAEDRDAIKSDFAKMLDEKLTALAPKPDDGDKTDGKGGKPRDRKEDVELATLKRQFSEMQQRAEESDRRASAERAKNRDITLRKAAEEVLEGAGITGTRFKAAYALLQQEGRIRYAADDTDDIIFTEAMGAEVDHRTGLSGWAKSEEAKLFIPPSGTNGSGSRPRTGQPQVKNGPLTPAERKEKLNNALADWAERGT